MRAAHGLAAARYDPAPWRYPDARIAIVGAGLAGMSAALTLAGSGIRSTVYECSDRIGGRLHSGPGGYWAYDQSSEWCGELIDSGHGAVRALADAFDLPLIDMIAAQPEGAGETYRFLGANYPREEAAADFAPVREALARDLEAAGAETTWDTHTAAGVELDHMSVHDWIATRVPGGHESRLGRLLDVAYAAEYAADTTEQSALNIVYILGYQPGPEGFSVLGESDERFRIRGGNEQLPHAIAESLPGPVELGWRLEGVRARDHGIALAFDVGNASREVVADQVILALPFAALRTVDCHAAGFNDRKRMAIDELGAGSSAKLALQFDERSWNRTNESGRSNGTSLSDTGYMATWETTRGQAGDAGILVSFTGGAAAAALRASSPYVTAADDPAVELHARELLERLEPVYRGVARHWNGRAALSLPALDPGLRCSYCYYRVGQYHRFGGYERVSVGNVHFAGDHCSVEFQGFMEGAAEEGFRAACELLAER